MKCLPLLLLSLVAFALGACAAEPAESGAACESNAECESNLCVDNVCAEAIIDLDEGGGDAGPGEELGGGIDVPADDAGSRPDQDAIGADDATTDAPERDTDESDVRPADVVLDTAERDGGDPDAGDPDAGDPDAGDPDAGDPDAGDPDAGDPDAGDPDAGDPDAGEPDVESDVPRNPCGGTSALEAAPGDPCGPCALDELVCDGREALVCSGETTNECGGCERLDADPGTTCGECGGGEWVCEGEEGVVCIDDGGENACGGCSPLAGVPGEPCGTCGTGRWACGSTNLVSCFGDEGPAAQNACGGCEPLEGTLGDACGTCDQGQLECAGRNRLVCGGDPGADVRNECGGCERLDGRVGQACGECGDGALACDGAEALACEGAELERNACGACGPLDGEPGEECNACGAEWTCTDAGGVRCAGPAENACGGCFPLVRDPGERCFNFFCEGNEGVIACEGENFVECSCEGGGPADECGNFALDEGETCDDGGREAGDGCSASCDVEAVPTSRSACNAATPLAANAILTFDLCDTDDTTDLVTTGACTFDGTDNDAVFRIEVPVASRVRVEAFDDDDEVAIDVVASLRDRCNNEATQLACGDDVDCDSTDVPGDCVGGLQPRVARFEVDVEPGVYFLIIDHFTYDFFDCGEVTVEVTSEPLDG